MSRKPPSSNAHAKASPAGGGGSTISSLAPSSSIPDDFCPVCKRVKYLNTDMEFLINPECYHPMCSQCVGNIFKNGPAQCPYASCDRKLRQRGFRSAFFGDLTVEREVDIRRRVQAVFNRAEDDFETLRDYNDYLQTVEDLTADLISGGDEERKRAEGQLLAYEQQHRADIEKNRTRGRDAETRRRRRDAAEAEAAQARRVEERREEERARAEEATTNAEVMEALARGESGSAAEIQARILARKRARVAEIAGSHFPSLLDGPSVNNMLSIRGLRDKTKDNLHDADQGPYDPFAGLDLAPSRYTLHPDDGGDGYGVRGYENPWLEKAHTLDDHRVPGYSPREYIARALFDCFAGLGVSVADEKAADQRVVGTVGARDAAAMNRTSGGVGVKMEVDDVFV
ncbi:CDK-activating kinase assembly factor MAT1-domain-containing protein [Xylariomycetidae sp. FL2044]|nr:CDK-activating kinase assembly factor MAT1-domain-containing protein [Xylariomycetidae sp. FL2044]